MVIYYQKNSDNEPEQSDGAPEDLDNEDLDEQSRVGGVGERRAGPDLADTEAAHEVDEASGDPRPEHRVPGEVVSLQNVRSGLRVGLKVMKSSNLIIYYSRSTRIVPQFVRTGQ